MKKYVAYYRVSTEKQGKSGLGIEAQKEQVLRYAGKNGIIAEFTEFESGRKTERQQLHEAISVCIANGATLLIAKLDRLSRDLHFITKLMSSKVKFIACDMPTANDLTIQIMAAFAEDEAKRISKRTTDALGVIKDKCSKGIMHVSKNGNLVTGLGNPNNLTNDARLAGAESNKIKALANQHNRMAYGLAFELRSQSYTLSAIAVKLNENGFKTPNGNDWQPMGVKRLLDRTHRNEFNCPLLKL